MAKISAQKVMEEEQKDIERWNNSLGYIELLKWQEEFGEERYCELEKRFGRLFADRMVRIYNITNGFSDPIKLTFKEWLDYIGKKK